MHAYALMKRQSHAARVAPGLLVLGLSAALCACDPQASPFFRGVPLLTVNGSVSIAENHTRGELQPALAFVNRRTGEMQILEGSVRGRFPSDFRLDVFSPPDDDVLQKWEGFEDEQPVGFAVITAVTENHPDSFSFVSADAPAAPVAHCPGGPCPGQCEPDRGCRTTETWCADEAQTNCYTETTICPAFDSPPEDCALETEGDRSLKEPMWRFFAGFSQNYAVAYLKEPAAKHSVVAAGLGAPEGLAAGYHLLRVLQPDPDLQAEWEACVARAEAETLADYNRDHGTNWASPDACIGCLPDVECIGCDAAPVACVAGTDACPSMDDPESDTWIETLRVEGTKKQIELGCLMGPYAPVKDPNHASISIEIGPNPPFNF